MKLPLNRLAGGALLIPLLLVAGCNQNTDNPPDSAMTAPTPAEPSAPATTDTPAPPPAEVSVPADGVPNAATGPAVQITLQPTEGNTASGDLQLVAAAGGLHLTGTLRGVEPGSEHGFHVHEKGDCSAPDASSAGGHFTAHGEPHGQPGTPPHHTGDMPNQVAGADGTIRVDVQLAGVEHGSGGPTDVAGRAIVLHQKADDYSSQPAGDSGSRIACGVIPGGTATDAPAADPAAAEPPTGG